jgi:hypothetical protein
MTDITKCTGEGCPLKETCHRFTAPAEMYQSYFMTPPVLNGKCEYYWSQNATSRTILDPMRDAFDEMNCDECGGFGYHKMSCSHVK